MLTSPKMRISLACCVLVAILAGIACSDDGPTSPSGPPQAGSTIVYSALGASDVMGVGSTKPCDLFADCNGTGYVWVAARQLRSESFDVDVFNVGIPTGVLSPRIEQIAMQYGITAPRGNIIDRGAPFVRNNSTLVTVFAGANDVNVIVAALGKGAGGANQTAYIDERVAEFSSDYRAMLDEIRGRARSARVIVLNLPNMAGTPFLSSATLLHKQAAQRLSVRMTTSINAFPNVTVIDLMCDSRFYQRGTYGADGFHLSDAGNSYIGTEIVKALTSSSYPAPPTGCSQMTLF